MGRGRRVSEMVERVAGAAYEACMASYEASLDIDLSGIERQTWSEVPARVKDHWRVVARAAIAVMREPSVPMIYAAWSAPNAPYRDIELGRSSGIESIYQAMIDEALK